MALSVAGLALPFVAVPASRLAPWLASASVGAALLAGLSTVTSLGAAVWAGREAHWTTADDVAWVVGLLCLGVLGATGAAPVTAGSMLYCLAMLSLAARVPPARLIVVAVASALVPVLARLAQGAPAVTVASMGLLCILAVVAHVSLARATHALAYVLAEREALLAERRSAPRSREATSAQRRAARAAAAAERAGDATVEGVPGTEESGWEGLVERLRSSLGTIGEAAGVSTSVQAEVRGLAPPSSKIRQNVLKIAQEAAHHALRDTAPNNIAVTLRRGDGGLVLEVHDDGPTGENLRQRRTLASLRGRVVPLGGSAELRRGDIGWVVRVRLPCDQLN